MAPRRGSSWLLAAALASLACDRPARPDRAPAPPPATVAAVPDEPSPPFRNVATPTAYVGDAACAGCHGGETSAYRQHAMSRSFHRWTPDTRTETALDRPLVNAPTGLSYAVVEEGGGLHQVEFLAGPGGTRLHEQRRRMDYVMGSGEVARSYFTESNGRLFQLPLTWYRDHGWDFSPGYEVNNARFDRLLPDRCIACHANYPRPLPHLEGKFAELRPGIGCERCHGPGALHVAERKKSAAPRDSGYDATIVNPARLPLERRLDLCEQCHVHTAVAVLREGKDAYSYLPSQPLRDQYAFFRSGGIDIVSHADRLRQSACFIASRATARPLECATCHDPHEPPPDSAARNQPCQSCHPPVALQRALARSAALAGHAPDADCVRCHMPRVKERTVPHGTFTEHWIRVAPREPPAVRRAGGGPLVPYFERDRAGPEAGVYTGMGEIVYATLANDGRALGAAATALQQALGTDTTRAQASFLLGVARHQLGQTDEAVRALEHSARADSNRPETLHALAQAYARAGRPAAAIEPLFQRALALQPALAWIRAEYADFLQAQGRSGEAERAYRSALAEQPGLSGAWFNLGTVLAGQGRRDDASSAFREAVQLEPPLGEALSPLLELRTTGAAVTGVTSLGSPLPSLPVRDRGPRAARMVIATGAGDPGVLFVNVPPRGFVQILEPDGTRVRVLATGDASVVRWDLRAENGAPIGGGLYRALLQGRDASGRPLPPRLLYFGVVRQRAD